MNNEILDYRDLLPEEKLMHAIFGAAIFEPMGFRHFLSDEGCQAVRDVLKEFAEEKSARDAHVVRYRFVFEPLTTEEILHQRLRRMQGASGWPERGRTLEQVGQHFGLSRERIRQIEAKTLRLLRHPKRRGRLKGYLPSDE